MPRYAEFRPTPDGMMIIHRSGRKQTCWESGCIRDSAFLCHYPIGDGFTCDRHMCFQHSTRVASETDYCSEHAAIEAEAERPAGSTVILDDDGEGD